MIATREPAATGAGREHDERVVLVTGAQSGIGAATARSFARNGWRVAINWLDDEAAARRVAGDVGADRALLVRADVADTAQVDAMFSTVRARLGRIDVLVNNAGIFPRHSLLDLEDEEWQRVLEVNLSGAFRCTRAAARIMTEAGRGGAIVNIASTAVRGRANAVHYAASKGGMLAMTRCSAVELAPFGIRVNAVAPGLTDTAQPRVEHSEPAIEAMARQIPLGRMGTPEDIADVVLFLASDAARYVTGQTLFVNGGSYMP